MSCQAAGYSEGRGVMGSETINLPKCIGDSSCWKVDKISAWKVEGGRKLEETVPQHDNVDMYST